MRKILRLIVIILMVLGIALSALNFLTVDSIANQNTSVNGTKSGDFCFGAPLNC